MSNRVGVAAAVLLACAFSLRGQTTFYQIDLVPTGSLMSKQAPVWKGTTLVFKKHPDGTLISLRKADVKKISQISQAAEQVSPAEQVVQIGNLAMQGGSAQAGPTNASAVGARGAAKGGQALGQGFYGNVVPGQTQGMPNSANDNVVGKTWAYGPANAVQSSPGAPPMMPSATSGQNPPQ
jgi:hypothetical protein